jgi:hypothetical protein
VNCNTHGRKWPWPNLWCYLGIYLERLLKTPVKVAGLQVEIWNQDLLNIKQILYLCAQHFSRNCHCHSRYITSRLDGMCTWDFLYTNIPKLEASAGGEHFWAFPALHIIYYNYCVCLSVQCNKLRTIEWSLISYLRTVCKIVKLFQFTFRSDNFSSHFTWRHTCFTGYIHVHIQVRCMCSSYCASNP